MHFPTSCTYNTKVCDRIHTQRSRRQVLTEDTIPDPHRLHLPCQTRKEILYTPGSPLCFYFLLTYLLSTTHFRVTPGVVPWGRVSHPVGVTVQTRHTRTRLLEWRTRRRRSGSSTSTLSRVVKSEKPFLLATLGCFPVTTPTLAEGNRPFRRSLETRSGKK